MKYSFYTLICAVLCQTLQGQCYPDRHNTSWHDGWISCKQKLNPNETRDMSHWVLYNFGNLYALQKMQVWNTNDPENLDRGMRNIAVDYSTDGQSWTELGLFELPQAEGRSDYEGIETLDFEGKEVQYVLITALDNYGGDCYGLSEVRFETTDEVNSEMSTPVENENFCIAINVYPNPFVEDPTLNIHSNCGSNLAYSVTDAVGRIIYRQHADGQNHINQPLELGDLVPGMYYLNVSHGKKVIQQKLVKME